MKKIRKGKTIVIKWTIKTNGENLSLSGRNLTLCIIRPYSTEKEIPFTVIEGNKITATFQGKDNMSAGVVSLVLYENKGMDSQSVVDTDAFQIVNRTKEED